MNIKTLKAEYDRQIEILDTAVAEFPWEASGLYADWCAQTFYYVSHSTRLLALSAALMPVERNDFHYRFISHVKEESGHENLALRDLRKLDFKLEQFPERTETATFYQTQYYYIQNVNPYAFFGYIALLEGLGAQIGPKCFKRAVQVHGADATRFLQVHAEEDPGHIRVAFSFIERLEERDWVVIEKNLRQSCERYIGILKAVATQAAAPKVKLKVA